VADYTLPDLDWDYGALEPHISGEINELHHSKHHAAYVKGVNDAVAKLEEARANDDHGAILLNEKNLAFHLGGHVNHSIWWKNLSPNGGDKPTGELAAAMAAHSKAHGGVMTIDDLASHRCDWVGTVSQDYRGHTLHEIPPNGQGIAAQIALGILSHFDLGALPIDGAACQHLQIEAIKLAFADVYRFVAEAASMEVTPAQMLDDAYLASRAKLIDPQRAQDFGAGNPVKGGTIYLSAADESGMMVSFIQSNYMGFGSGVVVPEFGLSLQNRGHDFSLDTASPNVVAPGKRPFHTIIPGFLTKDGAPVMSFGVMGGNMQPQGHVQTLVRMLDHAQQPQAACDAPRWRFNHGLEVNIEPGMNAAAVQGLADLGHHFNAIEDSYMDFGAGQFIWRLGDPAEEGYVAASDARRDGQAAAC